MASTLEKGTQERNEKKDPQGRSKASYLKSDAEFKKIFGLTKDLRVRLTRIPDHLGCGESFDSFSSLVKSSTLKETELMVKEERKQSFDKKRKAKTPKKMDRTKRRKLRMLVPQLSMGEPVPPVPSSVFYQLQMYHSIALSQATAKPEKKRKLRQSTVPTRSRRKLHCIPMQFLNKVIPLIKIILKIFSQRHHQN